MDIKDAIQNEIIRLEKECQRYEKTNDSSMELLITTKFMVVLSNIMSDLKK